MKQQVRYRDKEIIDAIKRGGASRENVTSFLYRKHIHQVVTFIQSRNGSLAEAKDIFQDAIIELLLAVEEDRFEGKSSLSTYLIAMSKNLWFRRFRRLGVEKNYLNTLKEDDQIIHDHPESNILRKDQEQLIEELLDQLPKNCKEVLTLWSLKYSMKEIAHKLRYKNEQIARNRKNNCLKGLKNLLKDRPEVRKMIAELVG